MDFQKVHGAKERQDGVYKIGRSKWEVIFGYGEDELGGYNWRAQTKVEPTREELREAVAEIVNNAVEEKILHGMTYEGKQVWLSTENQMNYRAAYDMAVRTDGESLPVRVKMGTDEEPTYRDFATVEELGNFCDAVTRHIQTALEEGWKEKDGMMERWKDGNI